MAPCTALMSTVVCLCLHASPSMRSWQQSIFKPFGCTYTVVLQFPRNGQSLLKPALSLVSELV